MSIFAVGDNINNLEDDGDDDDNLLEDSNVYHRFFTRHSNLSHVAKSVIDFHLTYEDHTNS